MVPITNANNSSAPFYGQPRSLPASAAMSNIVRMTDEELRAILERVAKASPGPWKPCGASKPCSCGLIWSLPADAVVASGHGCDNGEIGEGFTTGQPAHNEQ